MTPCGPGCCSCRASRSWSSSSSRCRAGGSADEHPVLPPASRPSSRRPDAPRPRRARAAARRPRCWRPAPVPAPAAPPPPSGSRSTECAPPPSPAPTWRRSHGQRAGVRVGLAPAEPGLPGGPVEGPTGAQDLKRGALVVVPPADRAGGAGCSGSRCDRRSGARPAPTAPAAPLAVTCCPLPAVRVVVHRRGCRARPLLHPAARQRRPGSGRRRPPRARSRRRGRHRRHPRASLWPPHSRKRVDARRRSRRRPTTSRSTCTPAAAGWSPRSTTPSRRLAARPGPGVAGRHRPAQPRRSGSPGCPGHGPAGGPCWSPTRPTSRRSSTSRVSGSSGTFAPTGLEPITVAPGHDRAASTCPGVVPTKEPSRSGCARGCPSSRRCARSPPAATTPTPPRWTPLAGPAAAPVVAGCPAPPCS